jgi:membrane protease YdiL (CAAX protease family)
MFQALAAHLRSLWQSIRTPLDSRRRVAGRIAAAHAVVLIVADMSFVWWVQNAESSGSQAPDLYAEYAIAGGRLALFIAYAWYVSRLVDWRLRFGCDTARVLADARWAATLVLAGGLATTVLIVAAVALILPFDRLHAPPEALIDLVSASNMASNLGLLMGLGLYACVFGPIVEELIYRACLVPLLVAYLGIGAGLLASAVIFAFLHSVPYGHGGFAPVQFLGGLFMSLAFVGRWSVTAAFIVHAGGNAYLSACAVAYVWIYEAFPALFR